jgi:hypothetical protein
LVVEEGCAVKAKELMICKRRPEAGEKVGKCRYAVLQDTLRIKCSVYGADDQDVVRDGKMLFRSCCSTARARNVVARVPR